ncbi:MAG: hypothetical protein U9O94_05365 [Nanoarchaeota archaeon]|nr:hypothetical protein [Nanoarchaeota archaeon]
MSWFNMKNYNIIYTDDLPESVGGRCEYSAIPIFGKCTIKIKPKYKDDIGLLNHELEHYRQFRSNPLHALMYEYIDSYRYKCELKAYAEQIKEYKYTNVNQCDWIITALSIKYKLSYNTRKNIITDVRSLYYKLKG